MQVIANACAVASDFGKRLNEFKAVRHEHIAVEFMLHHARARNAFENLLNLRNCTAHNANRIGDGFARHIEDDLAFIDSHHTVGDAFQIGRDVT